MLERNGKVVIGTGANGGIGLGMARGLEGAGARVVVAGRNREKAAAARDELGAGALAIDVDVTREDSVAALVRRTVEQCGRLDILVNNAGINIRKPPETLTLA